MTKQIFIQDAKNKSIYHSINEITKIEIVSSGIYDLYFKNGSVVRVTKYFEGKNILDIVDLITINN